MKKNSERKEEELAQNDGAKKRWWESKSFVRVEREIHSLKRQGAKKKALKSSAREVTKRGREMTISYSQKLNATILMTVGRGRMG